MGELNTSRRITSAANKKLLSEVRRVLGEGGGRTEWQNQAR